MAEEGFEGYHVPQQSRRDKLRVVVAHNQHQQQQNLVESSSTPTTTTNNSTSTWYDPSSLLPSDLLTAATHQGHHGNFHHNNETHHAPSASAVKQEQQQRSSFMMGFGVVTAINNGSSSSSSPSSNSSSVSHHHHHHHAYMDPQSSSTLHLNNPSIHVFGNNNNNNPSFLYQPQNLRDFDNHGGYGGGGGGGGEIMVFKPEPLSLSLSSHHNHNHGSNNSNNHNSNSNNGNNLPLELNLQRYGAMICGGGGVIPGLVVGGGNNNNSSGGSGCSNEVSRSCSSVIVPQMMGPFTGYASVLKGSRFLKPAQQLLEELCDVGGIGAEDKIIVADASLMEPPLTTAAATTTTTPLMECLSHHEDPLLADHGAVESRKKSRLLTMLDEVYRRYRQYYQQMHAVVTSFEYVSGLTNAAPYASLAIKTMSKHFRCLKNAITDQLQLNNKTHFQLSNRKEDSPRFGNSDRGPYGQRTGFIEHQPVWRPQRGLPERAVTVLRAWLFEHFLHPYPTDTDKLMLAKQTGLSRSQVSNWFINARVRLWKPMVEEIHMLETRQAQKNTQREEHSRNKTSDHLPSDNTLVSENPSTSAADKFQDAPYKRAMNELPSMPIRTREQVNLACAGNQQVGIGVSMGSASNSVSLTLGLHQNHGIGLAEPFPLSAAQRFGLGLETNGEGYVMSGFEVQNRHFGRDVIGGQLLHDFVG